MCQTTLGYNTSKTVSKFCAPKASCTAKSNDNRCRSGEAVPSCTYCCEGPFCNYETPMPWLYQITSTYLYYFRAHNRNQTNKQGSVTLAAPITSAVTVPVTGLYGSRFSIINNFFIYGTCLPRVWETGSCLERDTEKPIQFLNAPTQSQSRSITSKNVTEPVYFKTRNYRIRIGLIALGNTRKWTR